MDRDGMCRGRVKRGKVEVKAVRECGECEACCFAMEVPWLNKPAYTLCPNQCAASAILVPSHLVKHGCSIYANRPQECGHFKCAWLTGAFGPFHGIPVNLLRPDKLKIMLCGMGGTVWGNILTVMEVEENGFRTQMAAYVMEVLSKLDLLMMVRSDGQRRLIGPDAKMKWAVEVANAACPPEKRAEMRIVGQPNESGGHSDVGSSEGGEDGQVGGA